MVLVIFFFSVRASLFVVIVVVIFFLVCLFGYEMVIVTGDSLIDKKTFNATVD